MIHYQEQALEDNEEYNFSSLGREPEISFEMKSDDEDDDEKEDEDDDKEKGKLSDWGETDPADSPTQPWTPMDPTGPGSAV